MEQGLITVYCGEGRGKTTAALGQGILAASKGKTVIVIQFLKGKPGEELDFIKRFEPEIKLFRFEKSKSNFNELSKEEQTEEIMNIKNGLNFAKKVLVTGECDFLILDEVLGLVDNKIMTIEELKAIFSEKEDSTDVVVTGIHMPKELFGCVDEVFSIEALKLRNQS